MSTMAGLPLQTSNVNQFTNQSAARAATYAQQPPTICQLTFILIQLLDSLLYSMSGMAMANKGPPRGGPIDKK